MQELRTLKCKCGKTFQTAAPSRIADPVCTDCIKEEQKMSRNTIPPDLHKVFVGLRNRFGGCPDCDTPLVPLSSFKVNDNMYCQGCYRKKMNNKYKKKGAEHDLLE